MQQRVIEIISATGATPPLSHCHAWIGDTQWAYLVQLGNHTHTRCALSFTASRLAEGRGGRGGGGEGRRGVGREGMGGEGRGGEGKGGEEGRGGEDGKLHGRYPEEGTGQYTVFIHKPSHNAALALETSVLQMKNIEHV